MSIDRVGIGTDLHRLAAGRKLVLGHVPIEYDKGSVGHSDGDVVLHAIIDALAGAAGFLSGLYNNTAWFHQGFRGGLMAFTAAVLGGIGNLSGAVLGGFLIGIVSALSDFYFDPRWTQPVVFSILILIMVFRPSGLLGEQVPEKV